MDKLADTTYIKLNATKQWLLSHGFRYNRQLSDDESEVYTYRFPVYKYEKFTTLEGEFCIVLGDDEVKINVYDYGTSDRYAPFYYCEYGNYDAILRIIWRNIEKQLRNLGINKKDVDGLDKDRGIK